MLVMPSPLKPLITFRFLSFVIFSMLVSSCSSMRDADGSDMIINRKDVASWNRRNVWIESNTQPHWCFPRDMKPGTPVDDDHGHWVVDSVDKWRFYVPNSGTASYRKEQLEAMAILATNLLPERESLLTRFLDGFFDFAGKLTGGMHG